MQTISHSKPGLPVERPQPIKAWSQQFNSRIRPRQNTGRGGDSAVNNGKKEIKKDNIK